jgi:hypothetical protein
VLANEEPVSINASKRNNKRNFLFIMESVKLFMSNVQYEVIEVDALN